MNPLKTPCFYHKDQPITNFCRDKKCLMPLCPNCISEHSLFHEEHNTKPQYTTIFETLSDVEKLLYNSICAFEADQARIVGLSKTISQLEQFIHQKINNTKSMVYGIIQDSFKDLERSIKKSINALHEQTGLYELGKAQKMSEELSSTIDELYNLNEGLKGSKYLGHIILFLKQKQKEHSLFRDNLLTFLDVNEQYSPKIELASEGVSSLSHCIHRMLKVEGKKEFTKRKELEKEEKNYTVGKWMQKDHYQKNQKVERSYTPQRSASYLKPSREIQASKITVNANHFPYYPDINHLTSFQDPVELTVERQYPRQSSPTRLSQFSPNPQETSRARDFKQEYELLSRKVSQMRKDSQLGVTKYK